MDLPYPADALSNWLESVALNRQHAIHYLHYILCSDDFVLQLNLRHLDHDDYTDILTFPYNYFPIESEIFLSMDRILDNSVSMSLPFEEEFLRVCVHGLLHMMGYKDGTEEEKTEIRNAENEAILLFHRTFRP